MMTVWVPVTMLPWVKVRVPVPAPESPTVTSTPFSETFPLELLMIRLRKFVGWAPPMVWAALPLNSTVVLAPVRPGVVELFSQLPRTLMEAGGPSKFGSTPELIRTLKNWSVPPAKLAPSPFPVHWIVPPVAAYVPLKLNLETWTVPLLWLIVPEPWGPL